LVEHRSLWHTVRDVARSVSDHPKGSVDVPGEPHRDVATDPVDLLHAFDLSIRLLAARVTERYAHVTDEHATSE